MAGRGVPVRRRQRPATGRAHPTGFRAALRALGFLERLRCLWAVDHGEVTLDGRTGQVLAWDGEEFTGTGDHHPLFAPHGDESWAVSVTVEAVHPYDDATRIGALAAAAYTAAGLRRPLGHGVLEPMDRTSTATAIPQPGGLVERVEILAAVDEPLARDGLEGGWRSGGRRPAGDPGLPAGRGRPGCG